MTQKLPPFGFAEDILLPQVAREPPSHEALEPIAFPARGGQEQKGSNLQLVTFSLDEEVYSVPVSRVRRVIRIREITRVPQAPAHVRGVHDLDGAVLPVLEIRTRLGLAPATVGQASRIVVVEGRGKQLGLLVDAVHQVARIPRSTVAPPPDEVRSRFSEHVSAVAPVRDRLVLLLDLDRLLFLPELA